MDKNENVKVASLKCVSISLKHFKFINDHWTPLDVPLKRNIGTPK